MLQLRAEPLAIRNALYAQVCTNTTGELLDVTDPSLKGRLTSPHGGLSRLVNRFSDYPHDLKTTVVVAYLVDTNGNVQHATLLTHTGDPVVDSQAVKYWDHFKYDTPAKLDGKPVSVLMYFKMLPFNTHIDVRPPHGT